MNEEPLAALGGRKFAISILGILLCTLLPFAAAFVPKADTGIREAIGAIGAIVIAFITGNAAVSWAWSKNTSEVLERGGKAIEDGDGV